MLMYHSTSAVGQTYNMLARSMHSLTIRFVFKRCRRDRFGMRSGQEEETGIKERELYFVMPGITSNPSAQKSLSNENTL